LAFEAEERHADAQIRFPDFERLIILDAGLVPAPRAGATWLSSLAEADIRRI